MSKDQIQPVNEAFPVVLLQTATLIQHCMCCDNSKKIDVAGVLVLLSRKKRAGDLKKSFPQGALFLEKDDEVFVVVFACAEHMQKLIKLSSEMEGQDPMLFSVDMVECLK